jgi:ATPase components of ABC transporters with duplicated ATPase domains
LNLLLGKLPHDGKIDVPVPLDYFPYAVDDKTQWTRQITEQIAAFEPWQLERELSLLDVSLDVLERPFASLSGGEQTKILLATLFLNENRFLLIDEPTNHLDLEGREAIGNYLRKKEGFILVSHDRTLLDRCVDHVLSINRSNIELQQGNFSTWQQNRDYQEQFEESKNRKLQRDIKRLNEACQRSAHWAGQAEKEKYGNGPVDRGFLGSKAARIMNRAKATDERRQKALEEKSQLFQNTEVDDRLTLTPLKFHSSRLLDLVDVSVCYQEDMPLLEHFSLVVGSGDRIALCGKNGCGKSSLLRLIAGEAVPHFGRCLVPSSLKVSYVPQETSHLQGSMRDFIEERKLDESFFKTILHKLGLPREEFDKEMSGYSAGQKKKVFLAVSFCEQAHLYLWDEPLNYMDVISRMQIETMLLESFATVIFIEHDKSFLDSVATKKITL